MVMTGQHRSQLQSHAPAEKGCSLMMHQDLQVAPTVHLQAARLPVHLPAARPPRAAPARVPVPVQTRRVPARSRVAAREMAVDVPTPDQALFMCQALFMIRMRGLWKRRASKKQSSHRLCPEGVAGPPQTKCHMVAAGRLRVSLQTAQLRVGRCLAATSTTSCLA